MKKAIMLFAAAVCVFISVFAFGASNAASTAGDAIPQEPGDGDDFEFEWIIPPDYYRGFAFSEGRAWVQKEEDGPWTLFDADGNIIKDNFEYKISSEYKSGFASFETRDFKMQGLLNLSGDVITPPLYRVGFHGYSEGLIEARKGKPDYLWGFIDTNGSWAIPPQFQDARPFGEEMAPVQKDGKWGYIDKRGEWVIPPRFENAYPFRDGMARIVKDGKYGFIDKNGTQVIDFLFEEYGGDFIDGAAPVKAGNLYGLIDRKGNYIAEPQFEGTALSLTSIQSKAAFGFVKDGKVGYIDTDGNVLIDFKYIRTYGGDGYTFEDGLAVVRLDEPGHPGAVIDDNGNIVFRIPPSIKTYYANYRNGYLVDAYGDDGPVVINRQGKVFNIYKYTNPVFEKMPRISYHNVSRYQDNVFVVQGMQSMKDHAKSVKIGYFKIIPKEVK